MLPYWRNKTTLNCCTAMMQLLNDSFKSVQNDNLIVPKKSQSFNTGYCWSWSLWPGAGIDYAMYSIWIWPSLGTIFYPLIPSMPNWWTLLSTWPSALSLFPGTPDPIPIPISSHMPGPRRFSESWFIREFRPDMTWPTSDLSCPPDLARTRPTTVQCRCHSSWLFWSWAVCSKALAQMSTLAL